MRRIPDPLLTAVLLGVAVGFLLGFFGGGGSILAVPALVWGVGLSPQVSVAVSLAVVGPAAGLGAFLHARSGNVSLRTAATFGGPAIVASYVAAALGRNIPDRLLMVGFGILAAAAGIRMMVSVSAPADPQPPSARKSLLAGLAVGTITGLFGVGGGFIVVPALMLALNLPVRQAVGTSLAVIAATATAGLVARFGDLYLDAGLVGFAAAALVGVATGSTASTATSPDRVRKGFAVILMMVALGTVAQATQGSFPAASAAPSLLLDEVSNVI